MTASSSLRQAVALHRAGRLAEAEQLYRLALDEDPAASEVPRHLGILHLQQGRNAEALAMFDRALALESGSADNWAAHGNALLRLARPAEAAASYRQALVHAPDHAEAQCNLGNALAELGRHEEALTCYDRVLVAHPGDASALYNRGSALMDLQRFAEALASFEAAAAGAPRNPALFLSRGLALEKLHRPREALESYDRALLLRPDYALAHYNRGGVLRALRLPGEALKSFDRALALRPGFLQARNNRCAALQDLGRYGEAAAGYEAILAAEPGHPHAMGGLAHCLLHACDWDRAEAVAPLLRRHVEEALSLVPPGTLIGYSSDPALLLRCARTYIAGQVPAAPPPLWNGVPYGHDKIRLAYLSADFHEHATARLMAELFERHDRARFEVIGVGFDADDGSVLRRRLLAAFDQFHDVRRMSDKEAAQLLRALEVDIAIDLKGPTRDARPGILAHRPAPVQIGYLGFPGTLGADFIDYMLADATVLPRTQQTFFTEQIVHLPGCYQVNDSQRAVAAATPSREEAGLPEQGFVFCCFNNNWKITAPLFDIWMRLLKARPGSVLWLIQDNDDAKANLRAQAQARGVDPARLVFALRVAAADHMARHRLADLFLDTLPCNAHTTASDALWMGVPLVTCRGETFAGRVGASLLAALGLPELVAENLEHYEALALALSGDAARRQALAQRLAQSRSAPLFDGAAFARHIEAAYQSMWQRAERGQAPQGFAVD